MVPRKHKDAAKDRLGQQKNLLSRRAVQRMFAASFIVKAMGKKAMPKAGRTPKISAAANISDAGPFASNAVVLVTLNSPREKFWGAILNLASPGISLRGIDLNSMEDFIRQVKAGDMVTPNAVFFPMHRIEKIELDQRNGDIPSLEERFQAKTGFAFSDLLREFSAPATGEPER
jgi:hypothetical protein